MDVSDFALIMKSTLWKKLQPYGHWQLHQRRSTKFRIQIQICVMCRNACCDSNKQEDTTPLPKHMCTCYTDRRTTSPKLCAHATRTRRTTSVLNVGVMGLCDDNVRGPETESNQRSTQFLRNPTITNASNTQLDVTFHTRHGVSTV